MTIDSSRSLHPASCITRLINIYNVTSSISCCHFAFSAKQLLVQSFSMDLCLSVQSIPHQFCFWKCPFPEHAGISILSLGPCVVDDVVLFLSKPSCFSLRLREEKKRRGKRGRKKWGERGEKSVLGIPSTSQNFAESFQRRARQRDERKAFSYGRV